MAFDWKHERRWLAVAGRGLAAAGFLRYTTQNRTVTLTEGLLIAGGVLISGRRGCRYRDLIAFFGQRSAKLGTNTLSLTVLVLVVLGVLNFLGYRHHKRIDLTTEKLYTLSDQIAAHRHGPA